MVISKRPSIFFHHRRIAYARVLYLNWPCAAMRTQGPGTDRAGSIREIASAMTKTAGLAFAIATVGLFKGSIACEPGRSKNNEGGQAPSPSQVPRQVRSKHSSLYPGRRRVVGQSSIHHLAKGRSFFSTTAAPVSARIQVTVFAPQACWCL